MKDPSVSYTDSDSIDPSMVAPYTISMNN